MEGREYQASLGDGLFQNRRWGQTVEGREFQAIQNRRLGLTVEGRKYQAKQWSSK